MSGGPSLRRGGDDELCLHSCIIEFEADYTASSWCSRDSCHELSLVVRVIDTTNGQLSVD